MQVVLLKTLYSIRRTRNLLVFNIYPKIEPGAEIVVPKKAFKAKMSPAELASLSTQLGLGLSTIAIALVTLKVIKP